MWLTDTKLRRRERVSQLLRGMGGCASNLSCPCFCLHCTNGHQGSSISWCCFGCSSNSQEERCDWPCFKCWSGSGGSGVRICLCCSCGVGHENATQNSANGTATYPQTGAAATAPQSMQAPQQQGGMYPAVNKY
ncbi:hypothetical protein WJX77_004188 [Trebouxia sp. C0004]